MNFRKSTIGDVDFILRGIIEIYNIENVLVDVELEKNNIINAISTIDNTWIIIAENESQKLGFVWFINTNKCFFGVDYTPMDENYIWISSTWTDPAHRNKNVASQLYQCVIDKAKELNVKKIWLNIYNSNKKSIDFYTKKGFAPEITLFSLDI